jgi:hypothetical protein
VKVDSFNWECPYCRTKTTIVCSTNFSSEFHYYISPSKYDLIGLETCFTVCPNPDCRELVISARLYKAEPHAMGSYVPEQNYAKPLFSWTLRPQSSSRLLPDYIAQQIRDDYYEACSILNSSPKASATLARRCLQGMIRDFWKIVKSRLVDEIDALNGKIDPSTWDAIDAIRKIGNIGAHMERDVNLIIDIEEDEASILIKLLEDLFQDWYITRQERNERNQKITGIAAAKKNPPTP